METDRKIPSTIRFAFTREVLKRSSLLAVVVGCLLTLTNQLDVLLSQPWTARLSMKVLLNFLIPFVVASAGAVMNRKCP